MADSTARSGHVNRGRPTYQIQILADPDHRLLESTQTNNVSVRTIVLGGCPGARTLTAPPVDGVDTETAWQSLGLPF